MKFFCFFVVGLISVGFSFGQNANLNKSKPSKAIYYMDEDAYDRALQKWKKLLEKDKNNPEYLYYAGVCSFNVRKSKSEAKSYFEAAIEDIRKKTPQESDVPLDAYIYLGIIYRFTYDVDKNMYEFEKSLHILDELRQQIGNNDNEEYAILLNALERQKEVTKKAIELVNNPTNIEIKNMGTTINSQYSEHSAVFSKDEKSFYFTSKSPKNSKNKLLNEDIFVTYIDEDNNQWQSPKRLGTSINSDKSHEVPVSLLSNDSTLIFFRDNSSKKSKTGFIFMSETTDNGKSWSKPTFYHNKLTSSSRETHVSISKDENFMFFVSNSEDGYGGKDIYMRTKLSDGSWSEPKILPKNINSEYDEETPFLHPNGQILFFSSKGHDSMGEFDIFMANIIGDNEYSDPINLGYPINTPNDDVAYSLSSDGKHGYLSSIRHGGFGDLDIYEFFIPEVIEDKEIIFYVEVFADDKKFPNAVITVKDAGTNEIIGEYKADKDGNYILPLKIVEKMQITCEAHDYDEITILYTPKDDEIAESRKNNSPIALEPIRFRSKLIAGNKPNEPNEPNEPINEIDIKNILFDFDEFSIKPEYYSRLDSLADLLNKYPDMKIEISGNTDNLGSILYNDDLSLKRAQAVKNYLEKKEVNPESLVVKGYGFKNPVMPNQTASGEDNSFGRKQNRRVDFIILSTSKE
ncbi:OmpA family protein [Bacteroidales bacterium OttesenSCG-928-I21]|nr:OmpA family protein [Bacteroidales bacterium OttesenSCG-928-I21]